MPTIYYVYLYYCNNIMIIWVRMLMTFVFPIVYNIIHGHPNKTMIMSYFLIRFTNNIILGDFFFRQYSFGSFI